jgi:hypothetical protein
MDGPGLIRREGGRTASRLQWPNGGAMAGKTETSLEFTVLAILAIIRKMKSTGRE